jgi:hypothetical protein
VAGDLPRHRPLVNAGGAGPAAGARRKVEAILEIEVDAERLYFEDTREGETGQVELFYLLGEDGSCEVTVLANEPWGAGPSPATAGPPSTGSS